MKLKCLTQFYCIISVPNFMEIKERKGCFYMHLSFGTKKKKITNKFQEPISQELLGRFFSDLVCEVRYMKALTYVSLVEIGPIVFELWEAEIG